ncbi:MAG: tetratricopeptide repeat protein [Desulfobacterales bacterium]|nr:tetratricopeptide repeat protein [Desulfobacterales bacterium]
MSNVGRAVLAVMILGVFLASGCGGSFQADQAMKDGKYEEAVSLYSDYLRGKPDDVKARGRLGFAYLKTGRLDEAEAEFQAVLKAEPGEPYAVLYLGMVYLNMDDNAEAIRVWQGFRNRERPLVEEEIKKLLTVLKITHNHQSAERALDLEKELFNEAINQDPDSFYVVKRDDTLGGVADARGVSPADLKRWNRIRGAMIREGQKLQVRDIQIYQGAAADPNTIAVCYFKDYSPDKSLRAFQKGLAAMVTTDLSRIKSVKVVERLRLQALLEEMKLGQTGVVDLRTAPKTGRLLRAENMVVGGLSLGSIEATTSLASASKGSIVGSVTVSVEKERFFDLSPGIVKAVADILGLSPTSKEIKDASRIHTKNYKAFIYYGEGLDALDAGHWKQARDMFLLALKEDPVFDLAREARDAAPDASTPDIASLKSMTGLQLANMVETNIDNAMDAQGKADKDAGGDTTGEGGPGSHDHGHDD